MLLLEAAYDGFKKMLELLRWPNLTYLWGTTVCLKFPPVPGTLLPSLGGS